MRGLRVIRVIRAIIRALKKQNRNFILFCVSDNKLRTIIRLKSVSILGNSTVWFDFNNLLCFPYAYASSLQSLITGSHTDFFFHKSSASFNTQF